MYSYSWLLFNTRLQKFAEVIYFTIKIKYSTTPLYYCLVYFLTWCFGKQVITIIISSSGGGGGSNSCSIIITLIYVTLPCYFCCSDILSNFTTHLPKKTQKKKKVNLATAVTQIRATCNTNEWPPTLNWQLGSAWDFCLLIRQFCLVFFYQEPAQWLKCLEITLPWYGYICISGYIYTNKADLV